MSHADLLQVLPLHDDDVAKAALESVRVCSQPKAMAALAALDGHPRLAAALPAILSKAVERNLRDVVTFTLDRGGAPSPQGAESLYIAALSRCGSDVFDMLIDNLKPDADLAMRILREFNGDEKAKLDAEDHCGEDCLAHKVARLEALASPGSSLAF